MSLLRKRLEKLEDRLAPPEGRPFCIWGMTSFIATPSLEIATCKLRSFLAR
jgi:hypothetical protein